MRTFVSKGPLVYIAQENSEVTDVGDDHLTANSHYGASALMLEELINGLPHAGPIFCDDNKTVFMVISKDGAGTSVELTIKSYPRRKDGWATFLALISNHASDTKYRAIFKSRSNLLQNIKWNGQNYPFEEHFSNQRTNIDDLRDCATHIVNAVPNNPQRVEFILESITSQDNALQASMVNIPTGTNFLRSDFEGASIHLIEVELYWRSKNITQQNQTQLKF